MLKSTTLLAIIRLYECMLGLCCLGVSNVTRKEAQDSSQTDPSVGGHILSRRIVSSHQEERKKQSDMKVSAFSASLE